MTRYTIVDNEQGDYYVIPKDKEEHWFGEWMYGPDFMLGIEPDYCKAVGGSLTRLTFTDFEIQGNYVEQSGEEEDSV